MVVPRIHGQRDAPRYFWPAVEVWNSVSEERKGMRKKNSTGAGLVVRAQITTGSGWAGPKGTAGVTAKAAGYGWWGLQQMKTISLLLLPLAVVRYSPLPYLS